MSAVARVIDVNANRAREALRVLEDAARFHLSDAELTVRSKAIRHGLQTALAALPAGWLECNRDAGTDAGREAVGANERARADYHAVVAAAGKRLGESLRSLEECLKVADASGLAAPAVERLRYAAYDIEAEIIRRMGSSARRQWRLCVLLTESLCKRPWQQVVRGAISGGAECIQVREKSMPTRQLAERVRSVIALARECDAAEASPRAARLPTAVIVNDRTDIALACGADGVHLGADDLSIRDARRLAGSSLIVGGSTHSASEAAAAIAAGADYCGVGAMFATATKPGVVPDGTAPQGSAYLRAFLAEHPAFPHLAIGGVTPENVGELAAAGAQGVAVSGSVCGAGDPAAVCRALVEALAAGEPVRAALHAPAGGRGV